MKPVLPSLNSFCIFLFFLFSGKSFASIGALDSIKSNINFYYNSPVCAAIGKLAPKLNENFRPGGHFSSSLGLVLDELTGDINLNTSIPGNYTVSYAISANADTSSGYFQNYISIKASPRLIISPDAVIEPGTSAALLVKGGQSYTWEPSNSLSCVNCPDPAATPLENTKYCVSSNLGSCLSSACVNVNVACGSNKEFPVPNAFSPDGDGNNEEFCLQGWDYCISDFEFMVFDRWGEKVFETKQSNACWDGSYKGKTLEAGVFIYLVNATYSNTAKITRKGNITLIR